MRAAVQSLVDRHEALRTTILPDGSGQIVHPSLTLALPLIDRDQDAWREQESRQPFDLVNGPLFRAALVRMDDEHHLLVMTAHHIVCDGSTFGVLLEDLAAHAGAAPDAAPLQFREYLKTLDAQRHSPETKANRDYWLAQCARAVEPLSLPADYPRPAVKTFHGARVAAPRRRGGRGAAHRRAPERLHALWCCSRASICSCIASPVNRTSSRASR
jgi:hypothetical protein